MSRLLPALLLLAACEGVPEPDPRDEPRSSGGTDSTPTLPPGPPPRLEGGSTTQAAARIDAPDGVQNFGARFAPAGDVDADGIADLLAAAPTDTNELFYGELHGEVWLVPGQAYEGITTIDTVAAASIEGTRERDLLGTSLASLGDWNGDGFDDFALGAPGAYETNGQVGIVYGPLQGALRIDTADARLLAPVGSSAGASLTSGADYTEDGDDDLIVAAGPTADGREEIWIVSAPVVADVDLADVAAAHVTFPADLHGAVTVANAGDLDGDGLPTLAVLATWPSSLYLFDAPLEGELGVDDASAALWVADKGGLPAAVSDASDSDGDGYAELPVGHSDANEGAGVAYLIGDPGDPRGDLASAARASLFHDGAVGVGTDVAFVGDLDGDGFGELAVGAVHTENDAWLDEGPRGVVYLLYGPVVGAVDLGTDAVRIAGEQGNASSYHVGPVGDLDGDGYDDLAIGAPSANARDGATGSLYLFLGGTGP